MTNTNTSSDLSENIYETLKKELLDLTIKPGEELVESQLCSRFGVTRPPVRTVLKRLSDIGLVQTKPYYGTHATLINLDKVYQIIHMRTVVETSIIQDFIKSEPNAFLIEELEHNIRLQKILINQKEIDRNKFYELDNELHLTWFEHQHCKAIWNLIQEQKIEYTRFRMLDYEASMQYEQILNDHNSLVQKIKSKNSDEIPKILGQHLTAGLKRMGGKVLREHSNYFLEPKDTDFWDSYNKMYEI